MSQLALTRRAPSGLTAMPVTASVCSPAQSRHMLESTQDRCALMGSHAPIAIGVCLSIANFCD